MDYLRKCRLCLKELKEKDSSVPLYVKGEDESVKKLDKDVVYMISYCVAVQIENITTLPSHICHPCFDDLKKCNEFKKKCQDSDLELRKLSSGKQADSGNEEPEDKTILLLTPEVTLTEGKQDGDSKKEKGEKSSSTESKTAIYHHKEFKMKEVKIRIKKLAELNGDYKKASESVSVSPSLVKNEKSSKVSDDELDEDAPLSVIMHDMSKKDAKKGKYQCSYCDETFRRQVAKDVHEKEHRVLYKCVLCYESFQTHLKLQKHRADVHNEDPYCCSFCSKTFSDVRKWTDHLKKNHVCCSKCKSYFKTQSDLDNHACLRKSTLKKGCSPEELQNRIQYDFPVTHGNSKRGKYSTEKRKYNPRKNYYQMKKLRLLAPVPEFVPVNKPLDVPPTEENFTVDESKQRGPFPCFRCDKDFTDKGSLICHQAVAHPGQPIDNTQRPPKKSVLFCKFCLSFFRHISDMNAHQCRQTVYPMNPMLNPMTGLSMSMSPDNREKGLPIPLSIIKKSFKSYGKPDSLNESTINSMSPTIPDSIEKKPVVPKLLPTSSAPKLLNETDSRLGNPSHMPSISRLFGDIRPEQVSIKEEKLDDYEEAETVIPDVEISERNPLMLKPNKRKKSIDSEAPESVFRINPNILATLGIRQDTSL